MTGTAEPRIRWLPPEAAAEQEDPYAAPVTHQSRGMLRETVEHPEAPGAWDGLVREYDRQAEAWDAWVATIPQYLAALAVALDSLPRAREALEVGCGTGNATRLVAAHADAVVATDVSAEMIGRAPDVERVVFAQADVRALPFADGRFDLVVGLNAVPYGPELARVCAQDGAIAWATSFGEDTPLHIRPETLCELLGPGWSGVAGKVGRGEWCVLRREQL